MADKAREAADKELQRMEKHLAEIYSRAGRELEQKAADYLADFLRLEAQHKKDVESGKWTQEEYDEWRKNKLLYGQKWDRLIDYAKKELASVNKTAIDYINGKTTQVFADSYNHLEEVIDNSDVKGYNFELVDAETVKNLYDNGELMLPHKDLDKEKDEAWNAKAINAEILQGILQGDSIPKIAQRMNNVATKNDVAAVRTARTMITAAENSGRQAGMNKAQEDGIEFLKVWIATADERTRESHVALDGTAIPPDEMFVTINDEELEFPGDWRADGCEVYNCRCSLGTIVKGFVKKSAEEDPQETEEQQEQQIEIEQQEDSAESLQPFVYNYNIEGREDLENLLNGMESEQREKWERVLSNANVTILENNDDISDNIAYNVGGTNEIFLYPTTSAATALHESSHAYDWNCCTMEYTTQGYREFLGQRRDFDPYTTESLGATNAINTIFSIDDGNDWGKSTREDLRAMYKWAETIVTDNLSLPMGVPATTKDVVKKLREFGSEYGNEAMKNLSDMIEATTRGNLPLLFFTGGHGEDYWKQDAKNEFSEGWAEFCQMKAMGQDEAIEAIRKILPNKINALEEVYNVVFNGATYEHRVVTKTDTEVSEEVWRLRANAV